MNRTWVLIAGLSAGSLIWSSGCQNTDSDKSKVQPRSQVGDDSGELDASTTVGMKTTIGNTDPIQVSGIGLVWDLPGTGSSATPGGWRTMLETALKKEQITNISQILDDPHKTTSLVLVSAMIPAGARKGDLIDIEISLPEDSKTTSLKGGKLHICDLYNSDTTGNIKSIVHDGKPSGPSGDLKLGDIWAKAKGPLIAGVFTRGDGASIQLDKDADGQPLCKVAKIWGGAVVTHNRPYYILMNPGDQNARMAATVAERLNSTFHAAADGSLKVATAKSKEMICANVPAAYRNNHYRFLLVARQVPILPTRTDSLALRNLEKELLDPRTTLVAAIKLEALGGAAMHSLKVGTESLSPWVRFASAEALTYLGMTDAAAELAHLAEDHPALRAPCLKALASMDDAVCTDRLTELMASPDPMLRYGAFCALRLADDNAPAVHGEQVNQSFWLHTVAPGSPGMIHLTSSRRCEMVLFGDNIRLKGPFNLPVDSDFTVKVKDDEATVTRIVAVKGKSDLTYNTVRCPAELSMVLVAIGKLNGGYDQAVELIRRADRAHVLTCPVVQDAITPELNVRQLAQLAATDPALTKADTEVARAGVVRPGVDVDGFDLPSPEPDPATTFTPPPPRPPLNRSPGHLIFKPHDAPVTDPSVVPAGGP